MSELQTAKQVASMGPSMIVDGKARDRHRRLGRQRWASMGPSMIVDGKIAKSTSNHGG